jgi:4-amino-4-deoxychorismate lyase
MSQLIESIKLFNGRFYNLSYHEQRANASRMALFGCQTPIHFYKHLKNFKPTSLGLYKCRIVYGIEIEEISFQPYTPRDIKTIKLVEDNDVQYGHKFLLRPTLDANFAKRMDCDEILLTKNGYLTDCYYYNVVFYDGKEWLTPAIPLLKGVQREILLQKNKIQVADLTPNDIKNFKTIHLINALTPLHTIILPTKAIIF